MQRLDTRATPLPAQGTVFQVDTINRELIVGAGRTSLMIEVPRACAVILHGERLKLRMIQPGDQVHILYTKVGNRLVAHSVEVGGRLG